MRLQAGLFFGWLRIESLRLELPEYSQREESADVLALQRPPSAAPPLVDATLRLDPAGIDVLLAQLAPALAAAGFEDVQLAPAADVVELTARVRLREWTADLMARVAVAPAAEGRLALRVVDAVTFGYVRRPAALLAHDLLLTLTRATSADAATTTVHGLGRVELAPLERLRALLLEPAGWPRVALDGVGVGRVALESGTIELRWARALPPQTLPTPPDDDSLRASDDAAIDEAIARDDLTAAVAACRQAAERWPERAPLLTERLLAILCARDGTLADAATLAEATRARWPELVLPSLALAAVATFRGSDAVAAAHFGDAARLAEARGDSFLAARAATAAAQLWRAVDPAEALPLYEHALALRPADRQSAEALAELYAAAGRWLELRVLLRARLTSAHDAGERLRLHLRAAELSYTRLRDAAAARVDLEAAAALAPDDRRVWEWLAQLCEAAGDAKASIAALERLVSILAAGDATGDNGLAQARALVRIASRYEDIGDDVAALDHYRRALALGPDDPGAQERFAGVAARQGDIAAALAAYRHLYERGGGTSDRRRRAAQRLLQLLVLTGDRDGARHLLPSLLDEPAPDVLIGLGRLEESSDELSAAADLWARAAAQLEGQPAAAAELERARLCRLTATFDEERVALARAFVLAPRLPEGVAALERLVVLARAAGDVAAEADWLDRLLEAAAERAPADPDGHRELALRRVRLYLDAGDAGGAARLLSRLADAGYDGTAARQLEADVRGLAGDFAGRAAILEAMALAAGAQVGAAALWLEAAASRLDADDLTAADADCVAAAALAPADPAVRALAGELAWRRHDWDAVAALYGVLVDSAGGEERIAFAVRLAAAHEARGQDEAAVAVLDRAVSAVDATGMPLAEAWRACAELYRTRGEEGTAADVYQRGAADARVPVAARVALWGDVAALLDTRLGRGTDAILALQEALALDGADLPTLDALDALQSRDGDTEALLHTLTQKLAATTAPELRAPLLSRLGALAASRGAVERARAAFAELAMRDSAPLEVLRWLSQDAAARDELHDDGNADHWDARLALHEALPDDERRAAHLRLAARAQRHERLDEAQARLWAAVELTPSAGQPPLLAQLQEVYTLAGRWADLVVVLHHHTALATDEETRLQLELERIDVLAHRMDTPRTALEAAQSAIAHHGHDPRLLQAWADAARAIGDPDTLAALRAGIPASERLALAVRLTDAPLALAVGSAAAAELPEGPARAAAWRWLAGRAREAGDAVAERASLTALWPEGDDDDRQRLVALLGTLGEHEDAARRLSGQLDDALAARRDPAPFLARLRGLGRAPVIQRALAEGLMRAADTTADDDAAAAWLREASSLWSALDDFAHAADALTAAQARRPADAALLVELDTLLSDLGDFARLREAVERHLSTQEGEARLPPLRQLAQLAEQLGDQTALQRYLAEVRRLEPQAAARVNVHALVRTVAFGDDGGVGDPRLRREIADAEQRLAALPADDVVRVRATRRRLGELYRDGGRLAESFEQFSSVLADEPSNVAVLRALVEVAESDGRWLDAARLLGRLSHLVAAPADRARLLHRAGELQLARLGNKSAASDCFLEAIDLDPTHAPTLRRLIDYFWSRGDGASCAELALALDEEGGFAAVETTFGTRARGALALAVAGDLARAALLGGTLASGGGPAALSTAALELANRVGDDAAAHHLRDVANDATLVAVRRRLDARAAADPRAAQLAAALDRGL